MGRGLLTLRKRARSLHDVRTRLVRASYNFRVWSRSYTNQMKAKPLMPPTAAGYRNYRNYRKVCFKRRMSRVRPNSVT